MANETQRHEVVLSASKRYGVEWDITCPFDRADEDRPCWPHHENGERFSAEEGAGHGCNLSDWWGEMGAEMIYGIPETRWPVDDAEWTGDGFMLFLGEPVAAPGAP